MTEKKSQPYSRSRQKQGKVVLKGDEEQKSTIPPGLKPEPVPPKPEPKMKTKGGKDWDIVPTGTGMYKVQFTTGGEIPQMLSGLYTTAALAKQAIEKYERIKG